MRNESTLEKLLLAWETAQDEGKNLTPEELCPEEPELRQELARRIAALQRLAGILDLEEPGTPTVIEGTSGSPTGVPRLSGYAILEKLDQGGMGVVYRARQLGLERIVAIKMLRPGLTASITGRERFIREAQALARLRHPNVVPIHEADFNDGQPYFVMEYLPGSNLAHRLEEFVGQPKRAVALIEKVARAVHHAHTQGVLHRDLKPSNVLLDETGEPFVADFGLARLLEATEAEPAAPADDTMEVDVGGRITLTSGDTPLGTPTYMAPEQFDPALGSVGPATDVWALGVMLFEVLTGKRPFEQAVYHWLKRRAPDEQPPRPGIDPALDAVVLKCLQLEPPARYRSALALAEDLARWQQGEPPRAWRQPWHRRLARKLVRRLTPALIVILSGGLVFSLFRSNRLPEPPPEVGDREERAFREATAPLTQQLRAGKPVRLAGRGVARVPHRWRFGSGRVHVLGQETGGESLFVSGDGVGVLELLPDLAPPYRIKVEARHVRTLQNYGQVGIFSGRQEYTTEAGQQQLFTRVWFADHGMHSTIYTDREGKPAHLIQLDFFHVGPPVPPKEYRMGSSAGGYIHLPRKNPPDETMTKPGPWRQIMLEVRKDRLDVASEGKTAALVPDELFMLNWRASMRKPWPDLVRLDFPPPLRGGVGIFARGGSVEFRELTIEPLGP